MEKFGIKELSTLISACKNSFQIKTKNYLTMKKLDILFIPCLHS